MRIQPSRRCQEASGVEVDIFLLKISGVLFIAIILLITTSVCQFPPAGLKLVGKARNGAKVHKVYDKAQTPYRRLLKSEVLTEDKKGELANIYGALKPVTLLEQIRESVEHPMDSG